MHAIWRSLSVMLVCLSGGWFAAADAGLILSARSPGLQHRSVSEITFDSSSLELLHRFEATFAIHGLQLAGAWNDVCMKGSQGPIRLMSGEPYEQIRSSTRYPLITESLFFDSSRIVRSSSWHHNMPVGDPGLFERLSFSGTAISIPAGFTAFISD